MDKQIINFFNHTLGTLKNGQAPPIFPVPQPISIERKHFETLKNNDYVKITSCDVWECLDNMKIKPVNPRSMGLVFKLAKKNNLIVSTDEFSISRRIQANNRPVRVWRFAL